jgi:hypothetical protein
VSWTRRVLRLMSRAPADLTAEDIDRLRALREKSLRMIALAKPPAHASRQERDLCRQIASDAERVVKSVDEALARIAGSSS